MAPSPPQAENRAYPSRREATMTSSLTQRQSSQMPHSNLGDTLSRMPRRAMRPLRRGFEQADKKTVNEKIIFVKGIIYPNKRTIETSYIALFITLLIYSKNLRKKTPKVLPSSLGSNYKESVRKNTDKNGTQIVCERRMVGLMIC